MAKQIDGHHGQCVLATVYHIVGIVILHAQVLAEAQRLRLKPCFLEFNQYQLLRTIRA